MTTSSLFLRLGLLIILFSCRNGSESNNTEWFTYHSNNKIRSKNYTLKDTIIEGDTFKLIKRTFFNENGVLYREGKYLDTIAIGKHIFYKNYVPTTIREYIIVDSAAKNLLNQNLECPWRSSSNIGYLNSVKNLRNFNSPEMYILFHQNQMCGDSAEFKITVTVDEYDTIRFCEMYLLSCVPNDEVRFVRFIGVTNSFKILRSICNDKLKGFCMVVGEIKGELSCTYIFFNKDI